MGWRAGEVAAGRAPRGHGSRSTGPMLATRSASGPMLAPRLPAPMSVGAPMRLMRRFMRSRQRSTGGNSLAVLGQLEAVFGLERCPGFLGGLDEAEQLQVERADHAGLDQQVEIDQPGPEIAPEQQHRAAPRLAGLDQRQRLEQFVERAEAAGETHQRHRAHQEVHLAQPEIVELEAELGRDVAGSAPARAAARCSGRCSCRRHRRRRGCRLP